MFRKSNKLLLLYLLFDTESSDSLLNPISGMHHPLLSSQPAWNFLMLPSINLPKTKSHAEEAKNHIQIRV